MRASLHHDCQDLLRALLDLDVPNQLLDLFFAYEWASILHQVISSAVLFAMDPEECRNTEIQKTWLKSYLVKQLMKSYYDHKEKVGFRRSAGRALAKDSWWQRPQADREGCEACAAESSAQPCDRQGGTGFI